ANLRAEAHRGLEAGRDSRESANERQQHQAGAVPRGPQAARRSARMARRIMISDEDLLLYYYRDGLGATERARIATALAKDPDLAQRLHRLVAQLDTAAEMPDVPVPAHVQQRWRAALATRARPRPSFRWQALAATVALFAVLLTVWVTMKPAPDQVAH